MKTCRSGKLRVDDETWARWQAAAAPDGNVSGWLKSLAATAPEEKNAPASPFPERLPPAVRVHVPPRDPEYLRKEAALLSATNPRR